MFLLCTGVHNSVSKMPVISKKLQKSDWRQLSLCVLILNTNLNRLCSRNYVIIGISHLDYMHDVQENFQCGAPSWPCYKAVFPPVSHPYLSLLSACVINFSPTVDWSRYVLLRRAEHRPEFTQYFDCRVACKNISLRFEISNKSQ